jgi:hypothetical protein
MQRGKSLGLWIGKRLLSNLNKVVARKLYPNKKSAGLNSYYDTPLDVH